MVEVGLGDRLEATVRAALTDYRAKSLRVNLRCPYDVNPVRMVEQPCQKASMQAVFKLYAAIGCAGVYRNQRLYTFGRELNVQRAVPVVRACHGYGRDFEVAVDWCLRYLTWDVRPTKAQAADMVLREKVAWAVVARFPRLRDLAHPTTPVLKPHGGHHRLGGILPATKE